MWAAKGVQLAPRSPRRRIWWRRSFVQPSARTCGSSSCASWRPKNRAIAEERSWARAKRSMTWTETERLRGPSSSARMMLCQVPSSTRALRTWSETEGPSIMPRRCETAFLRSQSENSGSSNRQAPSCPTTCSSRVLKSSSSASCHSLMNRAVVVCRDCRCTTLPSLTPLLATISLIRSVVLINSNLSLVIQAIRSGRMS